MLRYKVFQTLIYDALPVIKYLQISSSSGTACAQLDSLIQVIIFIIFRSFTGQFHCKPIAGQLIHPYSR